MSSSRREFLQHITLIGGAATALVALGRCTKKEANCEDTSGLSESDKAIRTTLKYVDKSPDSNKQCRTCNFFQAAAQENVCGGCTLVKGPINPAGNCTSWVQKIAVPNPQKT